MREIPWDSEEHVNDQFAGKHIIEFFFLNAYFHQIILLMWFPKCTKKVLFCIDNLPWK